MRTGDKSVGEELARRVRTHKESCAEGLFRALAVARREAGGEWVESYGAADRFMKGNLETAVELAARWAESGREERLTFFIGWLNFCANERLNGTRSADFAVAPLEDVWRDWLALVEVSSHKEDCSWFEAGLVECGRVLRLRASKEVHVLFIGDCLQWDIIAGLHGPCLQAGIALTVHTLSHRVPASLRNRLREISSRKYDLVFYSPFSHEFSSEYSHVVHPRSALMRGSAADALLDIATTEMRTTVALLCGLHDGPVYLHNTAGVIQHHGGLAGKGKLLLSARLRHRARTKIHRAVTGIIGEAVAAGNTSLRLVDETVHLARHGAWKLGKILFDSGSLHPTLLGSVLGEEDYFEAIRISTVLAGKKLVVCDLDNTLWNGVVGEGPVHQFTSRQRTLKRLKEKGILLSINSKNDPANVRWDETLLESGDFVAPQINWACKARNIGRIRDMLNLKVKDFVFVDDRPDERERVKLEYPEIEVLDATDESTWRILERWREVLPPQVGEDRTRMYRERAAREQFVAVAAVGDLEDESAAFMGLELHVWIREARAPEMTRAVELINRTNQFNLCGTRTTVGELLAGSGDSRKVWVADARDKFGSMGMVGVLVADQVGVDFEIPVFVLSCRAFGFGIEYALLNTVLNGASGREVRGLYQETSHNGPCRAVYSAAGFRWQGGCWQRHGGNADDPGWLSVQREDCR